MNIPEVKVHKLVEQTIAQEIILKTYWYHALLFYEEQAKKKRIPFGDKVIHDRVPNVYGYILNSS